MVVVLHDIFITGVWLLLVLLISCAVTWGLVLLYWCVCDALDAVRGDKNE